MRTQLLRILSPVWAAAAVLGLVGVVLRLVAGERFVGYGSYVPWGLWVAIYFHAVGIAGGVFAVGVLGYLFKVPGLREHLRVTLWVAAAALLTGLLAIWLDLGHPWRAVRLLYAPSFTSMMAFNSWMYGWFLGTIGICFALTFRKSDGADLNDRTGWLVPALMVGLLMAVAFPSQGGAFLGVVEAKPYWNTALMPFLFLASALASGAATLLLVHTFLLPEESDAGAQPLKVLRAVTIGAAVTYFVLEFAEISVLLWSPAARSSEPISLVLFGPFWWVFWVVHLGGGLAALFLLLRGRSLPSVGTGAFLVALTFVSARLNLLIPGQALPQLRGLSEAFSHPRLDYYYVATLHEYLVALFLGALGVGLTYAGVTMLRRFPVAGQGGVT